MINRLRNAMRYLIGSADAAIIIVLHRERRYSLSSGLSPLEKCRLLDLEIERILRKQFGDDFEIEPSPVNSREALEKLLSGVDTNQLNERKN